MKQLLFMVEVPSYRTDARLVFLEVVSNKEMDKDNICPTKS